MRFGHKGQRLLSEITAITGNQLFKNHLFFVSPEQYPHVPNQLAVYRMSQCTGAATPLSPIPEF